MPIKYLAVRWVSLALVYGQKADSPKRHRRPSELGNAFLTRCRSPDGICQTQTLVAPEADAIAGLRLKRQGAIATRSKSSLRTCAATLLRLAKHLGPKPKNRSPDKARKKLCLAARGLGVATGQPAVVGADDLLCGRTPEVRAGGR